MPTPRCARQDFAALEARRFQAARLFVRSESQAAGGPGLTRKCRRNDVAAGATSAAPRIPPSLAARGGATRATMNSDARPAFKESDSNLVANLRLEVREAYRPGRWMWQIVDARNGMLLEREFEFEYESAARQSG